MNNMLIGAITSTFIFITTWSQTRRNVRLAANMLLHIFGGQYHCTIGDDFFVSQVFGGYYVEWYQYNNVFKL